MRIDHESFGLMRPLAAGVDAPGDELLNEGVSPSAFGALLQMERTPEPDGWRRVLRLDTPPASQLAIGLPAAQGGEEPFASPRLQLRRLLHRHAGQLEAPAAEPARQDAVGAMLALLANFQDLEDAIVAREAAVSRD